MFSPAVATTAFVSCSTISRFCGIGEDTVDELDPDEEHPVLPCWHDCDGSIVAARGGVHIGQTP